MVGGEEGVGDWWVLERGRRDDGPGPERGSAWRRTSRLISPEAAGPREGPAAGFPVARLGSRGEGGVWGGGCGDMARSCRKDVVGRDVAGWRAPSRFVRPGHGAPPSSSPPASRGTEGLGCGGGRGDGSGRVS